MLDRIALMANYEAVPTDLRKLASHVGGVKPGQDGSDPPCYCRKEWPNWADPGNAAYKAMVNELFEEARAAGKPLNSHVGYGNLARMAAVATGDCVEAALGAAFAANRSFPNHFALIIYHG